MRIVIAIFSAPDSLGGPAYSGYQFAKAVLSQHHEIPEIFFYQSGVLNAKKPAAVDAIDWSSLSVPLKICRTTALEYGLTEESLAHEFQLSTLTEFIKQAFEADRHVIFAE